MKKKVTPREKHPRGKKVATSKDTPPCGPGMKNPSTSRLYLPLSFEDDEDDENDKLESDAVVEKNIESSLELSSEEESLRMLVWKKLMLI